MRRLTPRFRARVPEQNVAISSVLSHAIPLLATGAEIHPAHRAPPQHSVPAHAIPGGGVEHHPVGEGAHGRWQARGIKSRGR